MVHYEMKIGNWDTAIVKAVFIGFIPIPILIFATGWEFSAFSSIEIIGAILSLLLSFSIYLIITLVVWVSIGFPIHRLSVKYFQANWLIYIFSPLVLAGFAYLFWGSMAAFLIAIFGVLQASVFRGYLYRATKP